MLPKLGNSMDLRIAVPSGVGDVYWVLAKLQALRAKYQPSSVRLCVQKTKLTRAVEWQHMVSFVDQTVELHFRPDRHALGLGLGGRIPGAHLVAWPNAVIDRGGHLDEWLPELGPADFSFPVATTPPAGPVGAVVYVSSSGVNERWCPNLGPDYWAELIDALGEVTGAPPVIVGREWDREFGDRVRRAGAVDLIGKTNLREVAGLIQNARVVVGVICGMTILANHFRTPCVALHPTLPLNVRGWVRDAPEYVTVAAASAPSARDLAKVAAGVMR